jgi:spermidine synthase
VKAEGHLPLLAACFFASGFSALVYETAWSQQLALVFGAAAPAVAAVLAAYMAGLALGAAWGARLAARRRRPLVVYALLEAGVGAAALALPAGLALAQRVQLALLGGMETPRPGGDAASVLFHLGASFLLLLPPTALMGATLPLLVRHAVRREGQIAPRVGGLYTANTAGAAAGAAAAAFWLLPHLGLGRTVVAAAALNGVVALAALALARGAGREQEAVPPPAAGPGTRWHWILPLALLSGAVSFTYEVVWTRLLIHLVGGSVYAFGTLLATFLVGLALGSAAAARWVRDRARARLGFAVAQLAAAAFAAAAFAAAGALPALARALSGGPGQQLWAGVAVSVVALVPVAAAQGAAFPCAVRVLAAGAGEAPRASGRVFAWNTAGAIVGAVGAGFWLLPRLGFAGMVTAAVAVSLSLAAAAALAERPRRLAAAAAAGAGLAALALLGLATPWGLLRASPLSGEEVAGEVLYYGVGRSATVLLSEQQGEWRLTADGLPESTIQPRGARPGRFAIAHWLTLLPLAVRPAGGSLLMVGLGAGTSLEDLPAAYMGAEVVELEPEILRANRAVAARRRDDPLRDPRVTLLLDDARSALLLTARRFDAVVSQPSHPWTAGSSHLFTRDFFTLVANRLAPDGVLVQWIGLAFVDADLVRSLMATLLAVFPHLEVYQPAPGGALLFVASRQPLDVARTAAAALAEAPRAWAAVGVEVPEDLLAARVLDEAGARRLAAGAPVSTDARNLLQTRSPRVLAAPLGRAGAARLFAGEDPLLRPGAPGDGLYLVRRLVREKHLARAARLAQRLAPAAARQEALGVVAAAARHPRQAAELLARAWRARAVGGAAAGPLHELLLLYRPALLRGELPPWLPQAAAGDPAAASLLAAWRGADAGDWRGVAALEPHLAAVGVRDPLYPAALRLRVSWRRQAGGAAAREGLGMLAPLLGQAQLPDLVLWAETAAAAGDGDAALAALSEIAPLIDRWPQPAALRATARRLLASLPPIARSDPRYALLPERLSPPAP